MPDLLCPPPSFFAAHFPPFKEEAFSEKAPPSLQPFPLSCGSKPSFSPPFSERVLRLPPYDFLLVNEKSFLFLWN